MKAFTKLSVGFLFAFLLLSFDPVNKVMAQTVLSAVSEGVQSSSIAEALRATVEEMKALVQTIHEDPLSLQYAGYINTLEGILLDSAAVGPLFIIDFFTTGLNMVSAILGLVAGGFYAAGSAVGMSASIIGVINASSDQNALNSPDTATPIPLEIQALVKSGYNLYGDAGAQLINSDTVLMQIQFVTLLIDQLENVSAFVASNSMQT